MGLPVEPQQVYAERGLVQIIDVRGGQEWDAGHIEAAHHIPLDELRERLDEVSAGRKTITVDRDGSRSEEAAELLRLEGFDAEAMAGGLGRWFDEELPLVATSGGSGGVAR